MAFFGSRQKNLRIEYPDEKNENNWGGWTCCTRHCSNIVRLRNHDFITMGHLSCEQSFDAMKLGVISDFVLWATID